MTPGRALHRRNLSLAALAVAAVVAVGGCSRAHDCRPGTLFLNVQFAPYTGVQQVFVQVMVPGETTRSMTFDVRPAGATSGSVEVSFATYPEGKRADVVVRLQGAGGDLAMRSIDVDLTGGCVAAEVSFSATDGGGGGGGGGAGGRGGAAGTGGVAGGGGTVAGTGGGPAGTGGGTAGTTGGAGTGGATAGTGGAGGRGGTTGGSSGSAGTGGIAIAGAAGTGGVAGTGAGGRGGNTAGTGGTTGLAGRGGTTGTGGRGGTGGACTATGAESCFNNLDDDCDGNVDCADTDCTAGAVCVALDPTQGMLGVVMPDATTPCPLNYATATTINRAPVQAQCSGCSCSRPPVNCVATIYDYPSYAACMTDPSSQTQVGMFSSGLACQILNWHSDVNGYVFGVGVSAPTPMYPGCTPGGTATAGTPTWAVTTRFCATTLRGGGCATGSVCLPAITNNPPRCVMAAGGGACPTGTQRSDWYTGYTGNFACNPCSCGQTEGASCAGVQMVVGNNGSCTSASMYAVLLGGAHVCAEPGALLNPAIVFTGTPTSPTCAPQNTSSGSLTPTGPQAVCCR